MSDVRRNYELAFHINQNLEESRIMSIADELKEKLVKGGATVTFAKEPERQRLSYEIKHNAGSFFGYLQFNMPTGEDDISGLPAGQAGLAGVEEYIKLNNDILRSLILRLPSDAQKRAKAVTKAGSVPRSSADGEKLEKAVEDIIEKL